jgi:hypothetical protein
MRSQFLLVPAAVIAAATPAAALKLQTLEAAQAALYPGATLTPSDFVLTRDQANRLKSEFQVPVMHEEVRVWKASSGGWLYLDQVFGLNDVVTYLIAIDDRGRVNGLEVLVCVEGFCDIGEPAWKDQFKGKRHARGDLIAETRQISGSTLSTMHVTEGVKKVLAIHALFNKARK